MSLESFSCAHCDKADAPIECDGCLLCYCSEHCCDADRPFHELLCGQIMEIEEFRIFPLRDGDLWLPPNSEVNIDDETLIQTYPGAEWHEEYLFLLGDLTHIAYFYHQMNSKASKAIALTLYTRLSKVPVLVNRRMLTRLIPALQIEFGDDEAAQACLRDVKLRNQEQVQVRKGKHALAPRLVCDEDEWYPENDPGLMGIRILLQIKALKSLEDLRNSSILESKVHWRILICIQEHLVELELSKLRDRKDTLLCGGEFGSPTLLTKRMDDLRQRIMKNIRKVHSMFPYFLPAFFTSYNVMGNLPLHKFFLENTHVTHSAFLNHQCGWACCYDDPTSGKHMTQVAFHDIYGAYQSSAGAIGTLRELVKAAVDYDSEIEPYVSELLDCKVPFGKTLDNARADNADRMAPSLKRDFEDEEQI